MNFAWRFSAASTNNTALINELIRHGYGKNSKNNRDSIPLHLAAFNGHVEAINALITTHGL